MQLDPVELRGVGIQMTKLDGEKATEREAGQGILSFGKKKPAAGSGATTPDVKPDARDTNLDKTIDTISKDIRGLRRASSQPSSRSASPEPPNQDTRSPTASPAPFEDPAPIEQTYTGPRRSPPLTRKRSAVLLSVNAEAGPSRLPESSDGIDADFLAALPPELRQEVKRDFGRSRGRTNPLTEDRDGNKDPAAKVKNSGKSSFAHITKQLRPKTKTQLKASAIADLPLYGAWAKRQESEGRSDIVSLVSDEDEAFGKYNLAELKAMGIDPEVFAELPEEMRDEIVAEERRKLQQRKALHRPAETSRLRTRAGSPAYTRTASLSPSKTSRGGSMPPIAKPLASVAIPSKPTLMKATSLPDVLETITKWVESREGAPPATKDAAKVKKYLIKCMDPQVGAAGLENVAEVLRWMKVLLAEHWTYDPPSGEGLDEDDAGRQWWTVWKDFKEEMDRLAVRRFGAALRI